MQDMKIWTWSDYFKPGVLTYEAFQVIRESNSALTCNEIGEKLHVNYKSLGYSLSKLIERGLIVKSKKVKVSSGFKACLYALNEDLIDKRIRALNQEKASSPEKFVMNNSLKQDILKLIKNSDIGFTPQEIKTELGYGRFETIAYTCYRLFKQGAICRSPFVLPNRIKGISNIATGVYGKDLKAIFRAIERYMPLPVKSAFILVRNSYNVWPCWILKERTHICSNDLEQWFKKAFSQVGLISFKTVGSRTYYYRSDLPQEKVDTEIEKYQEKARKWILNITELGRIFEQKAIYTFVKYLQAKGQEVKTTKNFPDEIPNWLNKENREQYKVKETNENGNEVTNWANDVWKFNREPVDYIVFSRDKTLGHRQSYILSVKKDFNRQFGIGYYTSFLGCVKLGRTRDGIEIPDFLSATPVFICGETWGRNLWKFNCDRKGQAGIILTLSKMLEMIRKAKIRFPKEHLFQDMYDKNKAYELYKNHEEVLLGKDVLQLMKEKGFKIENDR